MADQEVTTRPELLAASDAAIDDAIAYADPMVLRGLVYQLTGDPEVATTGVKTVQVGVDVQTKKSRRLNDFEREFLLKYQELDDPAI